MLLLRSAATWLYLLIRGWPVNHIRMAFAVSNMSWELSEEMQAVDDPILRGETGKHNA